ncbi:MAG: type II toxin-antitoxin system HigB family toxin [Terriglobales bacterium]
MKLIGKDKLRSFMKSHARTRSQLESWEAEVEAANWKKPLDIKKRYPKASVIGSQQLVFNICGNDYRLWVTVAYQTGIVMVREIGTHKEYDNWKIV